MILNQTVSKRFAKAYQIDGSTGEKHPGAKLSRDQVMEIRHDPRTQAKIASEYGVSQTLIGKIRRGVLWKNNVALGIASA